jgi:hypothetical protein
MTRFESPINFEADLPPKALDQESQEKLNTNTSLMLGIQKQLIERYVAGKEGGRNNMNEMVWIKTFGDNFRKHFINVPENAVLIDDYQHAKNDKDKEKILKKIEDELYGPAGIFGLPKIGN